MMPSCDQTGVPGLVGLTHFHSSTISGSASLISRRTCSSVWPRQSPRSRILLSILLEAAAPPFAVLSPPAFLAELAAFFFICCSLHSLLKAPHSVPRGREPRGSNCIPGKCCRGYPVLVSSAAQISDVDLRPVAQLQATSIELLNARFVAEVVCWSS